MTADVQVFVVPDMPEGTAGLDVGLAIVDSAARAGLTFEPGDVIVVAQKLVSKAEGALVRLDRIVPSERATAWAASWGKDAATIEVVLSEATRIVRMDRGIIIAETRHGFVCANAGVDASNVPAGFVSVLPRDPDASARAIRKTVIEATGCEVGVIVSDTFGRPWREGAVNVAIGAAGVRPLLDCRGEKDQFGRRLQTTVIGTADEIASAAELVTGKSTRTPVAVVRGGRRWSGDGDGAMMLRPAALDLFR